MKFSFFKRKSPKDTFTDTLDDSGIYEQYWSNVIVMPLHPKTLKIDTLGFTVNQDSLTLVTLPGKFSFPGFGTVEYYLIFRFQRINPLAITFNQNNAIRAYLRRSNFGGRFEKFY